MVLLFLILIGLAFMPGIFLYSLLSPDQPALDRFTLGSIFGLVLFTLLGYLSMLIHLEMASFAIIALLDIYFFSHCKSFVFKLSWPKPHLGLLSLLVIGVIGQLAVIWPSGGNLSGNLYFWSALGHDGIWHISLINTLAAGFPLQNELLHDSLLKNYHFFSDIPSALIYKFFNFSIFDLHFRYFSLVHSTLLGLVAFVLGRRLFKTQAAGLWSLFFTQFCGSFGYIVTLAKDRSLGGESLFWASQIQSSIGNPPQIVSNILGLSIIYLIYDYFNTRQKRTLLVLLLIVTSLAEFKIYASVIFIGALLLTSIYQLIRSRQLALTLTALMAIGMTALLYLANTAGAGSLLLFEPWWFIRTMIVASDKLNWIDLELRRQTYLSDHNYKRVLQLELLGLSIFIFGNLGIRIVGLGELFLMVKNAYKNYFSVFILSLLIVSLALPLLFIQKGIPANTIQFFQYFLLVFGILAGGSIAKLQVKLPLVLKPLLTILVVILAIPTQIGLIQTFYSRPAFAQIRQPEILALHKLNQLTPAQSLVLSPPYQKIDNREPIPNIWEWSDTAYVSALSSRRTYLADQEQLTIMGYRFEQEKKLSEDIFNSQDEHAVKLKIAQTKADYLYFPVALAPKISLGKIGLQKIFDNNFSQIWKVR